MPAKPTPLLIDRLLRCQRQADIPRRTLERIQAVARRARVFALDDAGARLVNNTALAVPDLIAEHQEFARSPFDTTWIEFEQPSPPGVFGRYGFLLDHGAVYSFAGDALAVPGGRVQLAPYVVHTNEPWPPEDRAAFLRDTGLSVCEADTLLCGDELLPQSPTLRGALSARNTIRHIDDGGRRSVLFKREAKGGGGLAAVTCLLLLLNRPRLYRTVREVPARRRFSGGRLTALAAHTVVTIDLSVDEVLLRLSGGEDAAPRRSHEVRGHFAHDQRYRNGTAAGCDHSFVRDIAGARPMDRWTCALCGGRRWWRREHVRGDAGAGRVTQLRVVIASPSAGQRSTAAA